MKPQGASLTQVRGLGPLAGPGCKVLVLGTMPGRESLRRAQYYANPMNHFWKLIYAIFGDEYDPGTTYTAKVDYLHGKRIALWDVLSSCERAGSEDQSIRNPEANDLKAFLCEHGGIRCVFLNGKKAYDLHRRLVHLDDCRVRVRAVPSSSPANTVGFHAKLEQWKAIRDCLEGI